MPRVEERHVDALGDLDLLVVRDRAEQPEREVDLVLGVDRPVEVDLDDGRRGTRAGPRGRGRPAPRRPRPPARAASSNTSASRRSSAAARSGSRRSRRAPRFANSTWSFAESSRTSRASSAVAAVHTIWPRKPLPDEQRQQAAVVEVGVGEDDRVERRRVEPERHAVAHRLVRTPLEHAAVDEDPGSPGVHEVARAGDRPRTAEKGELHAPIVTQVPSAGCPIPSPSPCPPRPATSTGPRLAGPRRSCCRACPGSSRGSSCSASASRSWPRRTWASARGRSSTRASRSSSASSWAP